MKKLKGAIEPAEKSVLGVVSLFYLLGVLVTSIHLWRYGFSGTINLVRISYFFAGFGFVSSSLLSLVPYAISLRLDKRVVIHNANNLKCKILGASVFSLAYCYLLSQLLTYKPGFSLVILVMLWLLIGVASLIAVDTFRNIFFLVKMHDVTPDDHASPIILIGGALAITNLFLSLILFSTIIYPAIDGSWGGGKPKRATLILSGQDKDKDKEAARFLKEGLKIDASNKADVYLLYVTDSEYVLIVGRETGKKGTTLTLRKDMVQAIHYSP